MKSSLPRPAAPPVEELELVVLVVLVVEATLTIVNVSF
jgi:hypothetical protein